MQRSLGQQTRLDRSLLQPANRRQSPCKAGTVVKSGRPACQAASTLSNGEAEASKITSAQAGSSKANTSSASKTAAAQPAVSAPKKAAKAAPQPVKASPSGPAEPATAAARSQHNAPKASASTSTSSIAPGGASPSSSGPAAPAEAAGTAKAATAAAPPSANDTPASTSDGPATEPPSAQARQSATQQQPQQEATGTDTESPSEADPSSPQPPPPAFSPAFLRRLAASTSVMDVSEAMAEELPDGAREEDARAVLGFCLQRCKVPLALSIYREMCQARRGGASRGGAMAGGGAGSSSSAATRSLDVPYVWPSASLGTTRELVLGLCQQLCIVEALQVLADMKEQGLPRGSEEVGFGKVVTSPLAPSRPLTVVQPQEGAKTVADGYSRYEYDVFSGTTVSCTSKALVPSGNILLGIARAVGLVKKPPVAAVHEFVLQAPDSTSRTFRVGTDSSAVPAQVGERVTVVSAPARNVRKGGLFNASPPGTKPGEALTATNHKTGVVLSLLRPPASAEQATGSVPSWVLPLAVVLAGGDAASSLLDPALPLLLAAGAASLAGSAAAGNSLLLPKLKQLPDGKVRGEMVRQQLLSEYNSLVAKSATALAECGEDVRVLARLWQLQNKMESVAAVSGGATAAVAAGAASGGSSGSSSAYEARIGRVSRARANIEERLARRIELLDGYSRVMNMIEIEVEMDLEVPAAELAGIQEQVARLVELESISEDWRAQAEARDEVERLLRTA